MAVSKIKGAFEKRNSHADFEHKEESAVRRLVIGKEAPCESSVCNASRRVLC